MRMKTYLIKRLLYLFVVAFGVSFFIFSVTTLASGRQGFTEAESGTPYFMRYLSWLRVVLLGHTQYVRGQRQVTLSQFGRMIPGTMRLAGATLTITVILSLPLGFFSAMKKDSLFDNTVRLLSFLGASVPNFILGLLLLFVFAVRLRWFPVIGAGDLRHMVLPVCTLSFSLVSRFMRQIRGTVLEELGRDYVTGAMARGLHPGRVMIFHVLPNALPSILSYLGVSIGQMLSSVAIIEILFFWPGIGALTVDSVRQLNYPIITAFALWMALLYILSLFVVDTALHWLDPQFRRKGAG